MKNNFMFLINPNQHFYSSSLTFHANFLEGDGIRQEYGRPWLGNELQDLLLWVTHILQRELFLDYNFKSYGTRLIHNKLQWKKF